MAKPRTNTLVTRILGDAAPDEGGFFLARGMSVADDVGGAPGQVLAAIDGDHLTGHGGGVNQIAQGRPDLSRIRAVTKGDGGRLGGEIFRGLMNRGQRGSRAD